MIEIESTKRKVRSSKRADKRTRQKMPNVCKQLLEASRIIVLGWSVSL